MPRIWRLFRLPGFWGVVKPRFVEVSATDGTGVNEVIDAVGAILRGESV